MVTPRLILAVGVTLVGSVFTVLTLLAFDRQIRTDSARLHQAHHRAALKIISRDVDDLRRQLVQMHRNSPASHFDFLFFDRNGAGRVGVHGPVKSTWTPISNAYSSIFRAAFDGISGTAMRILDLSGNVIDANPSARRGLGQNEMADFVGGTNLVLRSSALPGKAMPGLSALLFLALLFWLDVGLFIYFITPDGESKPAPDSRPLALMARGYRLHDPVVLEGIRDHHYRRL